MDFKFLLEKMVAATHIHVKHEVIIIENCLQIAIATKCTNLPSLLACASYLLNTPVTVI